MSTDRALRLQLPQLSFDPVPPDPAPPSIEATYAKMLPAGHSGLDARIRRLLVTFHIPDRKNVLLPLLSRLADPQDLRDRWHVLAFTVEASLSASLAGVGAVALVVQPLFASEERPLTDEQVGDMADDLRTSLSAVLPRGLADDVLGVRPIDRGDEYRLYAGKHFREMRFGVDLRGGRWAARCSRLVERFAQALAEREVPLAYIHFPLHWDSYPDRWDLPSTADTRWLRMAYAVEGDPSTDAGIELAAWAIAEDEGVALAAYEPTWKGAMEDRFVLLVPPATASSSSADTPSSPPSTLRTPTASARPEGELSTVALGIDVLAKPGLVAYVMDTMADARMYGCTMAVLYGHTMCEVIVDEASSRALQARLAAERPDFTLAPHEVGPTTPIVRQSDDHDFAFWVAWCCGDAPGVMRRVIAAVNGVFHEHGVDIPNVDYAISRVLVDGMTCAGKLELVCSRDEAVQMGLLGRDHPVGRRADEDLPGWDELRTAVAGAVAPALEGWAPQTVEWRDRPVEVGDAEPSEQPWAWLVVPEGAVNGVGGVGVEQRWWINEIDEIDEIPT